MMRRTGRIKQCAVLGLGRFGTSLAKTLYSMGHEVIAVDIDESVVAAIANEVTYAVQADATDEQALRDLGIRNVDIAVVSVGLLEQSVMATLILKEMGVPCIVCKAVSDTHGTVLEKLGADRVVFPERDMGLRVAHNLISGNLIDYLELAPGYSIIEAKAHTEFFHRTLGEIDLRARYGINVIAVRRNEDIIVTPGADFRFEQGDVLIAMGPDDKLSKLEDPE
ncbi:MAG TPA: TrkA family potassium uptake protein [Corynebacteriales bacterium]|nr:TrkA family potassium uptake protein [Bacillota bacterium]HHY08821.1 TrkA family potassium uptake protein [Mycobacteriales bacterium]